MCLSRLDLVLCRSFTVSFFLLLFVCFGFIFSFYCFHSLLLDFCWFRALTLLSLLLFLFVPQSQNTTETTKGALQTNYFSTTIFQVSVGVFYRYWELKWFFSSSSCFMQITSTPLDFHCSCTDAAMQFSEHMAKRLLVMWKIPVPDVWSGGTCAVLLVWN